jgi:hypothetical protein
LEKLKGEHPRTCRPQNIGTWSIPLCKRGKKRDFPEIFQILLHRLSFIPRKIFLSPLGRGRG